MVQQTCPGFEELDDCAFLGRRKVKLTGMEHHFESVLRLGNCVNAIGYQKLLTVCKIFEMLDDRYGKFGYVLQQDGARPHTARTTLDFLASRAHTLPSECHWPACSPI